jgi:hypothetical protein
MLLQRDRDQGTTEFDARTTSRRFGREGIALD